MSVVKILHIGSGFTVQQLAKYSQLHVLKFCSYVKLKPLIIIQWNLRITDTLVQGLLSVIRGMSFIWELLLNPHYFNALGPTSIFVIVKLLALYIMCYQCRQSHMNGLARSITVIEFYHWREKLAIRPNKTAKFLGVYFRVHEGRYTLFSCHIQLASQWQIYLQQPATCNNKTFTETPDAYQR